MIWNSKLGLVPLHSFSGAKCGVVGGHDLSSASLARAGREIGGSESGSKLTLQAGPRIPVAVGWGQSTR